MKKCSVNYYNGQNFNESEIELLNAHHNAAIEYLKNNNIDVNTPILDTKDNVSYSLKAVNILQSDKAKQIFEKGNKNNWTLDRILTELQVPKEQKQLILDRGFKVLTNNDARVENEPELREQIITDLLANYSYTIEINTAKAEPFVDRSEIDTYIYNNEEYIDAGFAYFKNGNVEITEQEYNEAKNKGKRKFEEKPLQNSSYYSNLTVPGGTNGSYIEANIETPLIKVPKSHAQFNTENTIGFSRNDDRQVYTEKDINSLLEIMQKSGILEVKC